MEELRQVRAQLDSANAEILRIREEQIADLRKAINHQQ
jgi:hypothetical protein